MIFNSPEEIRAMTSEWTGERFADGRPKVADKYLDALYGMTLEELWKPIFIKGYESQFIAIKSLHPEFKEDGSVNRKLVGRALTAMYAPVRPDFKNAMNEQARNRGLSGTPNQWVIDSLSPRDVPVIDMYLSGNIIRFPDVVRGHTGSGPNVERQEAPHTHFVEISDDGSEVYCVDLGLDTIFVYDRELNEKARIRLPSGYGPRHLVFSEDRKAMFCVYELANAVSMLKRIGEEWKVVDTVPLLEQPGNGGAAAIRIFEDELYVSVRGADVLVRLKILDTKLQVLNRISCGGASPRDFDWIDGRLYCANENSNTVTIFQRDGENFVRLSDTLSMPHPLCVCALRD